MSFPSITYALRALPILQPTVTAALLYCTQKRSVFRLSYVLVTGLAVYWHYLSAKSQSGSLYHRAAMMFWNSTLLLHHTNILLILQLDAASIGSLSTVLRLCADTRAVGTTWQVKGISPVLEQRRHIFVLRQTALMMWQYLLSNLTLHYIRQYVSGNQAVTFDHGRFSTDKTGVATLSLHAMRLFAFFVVERCQIEAEYRALSVVCVVFKLSTPGAWPPLYGSIWDYHNLRQFWG